MSISEYIAAGSLSVAIILFIAWLIKRALS